MRLDAQQTPQNNKDLPDISLGQETEFSGSLSQVGMGKIEMPILYTLDNNEPILLPALISAFVSLDKPEAKGIHMSRLYLELKNNLHIKPITQENLQTTLKNFIFSHEGMSESAYIEIRFSVPLERKALISGELGFRQYPVVINAELIKNKFAFTITTEILYSSTCPCSAALARQLIQQAFIEKFKDKNELKKNDVVKWLMGSDSIVAFPHAQRSLARISLRVKEGVELSLLEIINAAENAVGTPVQSAVKRIDEQEFARLNASNLMFCEDAARRLRGAFESDLRVTDYRIYVEHQESLHPHDAVSTVVKSVPGGFTV